MPDTRKAIIYVRQSQDRRGDELGVARQRDSCVRLCEQRGWTILDTIVDNDVSASSRKPRPGFQRILRMVDAREIDVVVVHHVDRLVRKLVDLEDVIERCDKSGVLVGIASGDLDLSTDSGRLVGRILTSVARGEMERKGARQRDANAQAAAAGRRVGGRRPFGYRQNGKTIIPREAEAIRDAYTAVLAGASLAGIARDWNSRGLHSGQGAWKESRRGQPTQWTGGTLHRLLLNPRYAGFRSHNGVVVGKAEWEPLVSEETWRATVALLSDPARRRTPRGGRRLLTNIARCGVCGLTVHAGGAGHGKPVYRCKSMRHINRLAEPVDEWIGMLVVARLSRPDAAELLVDDDRPDVAGLRRQAQGIRVRLDTLGVEFADGELTPSQLRTITARLRARLDEIEGQMADAGKVDVLGPLVTAEDVQRAWDDLGLEQRRVIVDSLMTVTLLRVGRGTRSFRPETVRVRWTGQDDPP